MSKCIIEYNFPTIHQNICYNDRRPISSFFGGSHIPNTNLIQHRGRRRCDVNITNATSSSELVVFEHLNIFEAFPIPIPIPTTSSLSIASLAKRPTDPMVLLQTSAVMIFVYLIANFVVPALITKSMGFDKVDEIDKPTNNNNNPATTTTNSSESQNLENSNSRPKTRGFNSTKPK